MFLPKVLATMPARNDVALYVIDNASTDTTQEYLASFKDQIHVIIIKENRGFTNGYKVGLAQINTEIFCLLSSDVEVNEGWIEPVLEMFEERKKLAIVQPKIKSWHRKDEFEYAGACGGYIDKLGYPFCRGRIFYDVEKDEGQYKDPLEIFWASGACFFIRANLYHSSGGLDDDFYAHMEEIDLCWRLKNQGYSIMVCPQSEVFHVGGAVIAYGSPQKVYRNHRNNLIMMMKNYPSNEVVQKIIIRLFMDAPAFVNMLLRGQIRASFSIISAHWNFFINLPKWIKKRREIQQTALHYTQSGVYQKSIVADYFIRGKRKFSDLDWKP
jgi:GT2 family glycosyltransferase